MSGKPGKWERFSSQGILNRLQKSGKITQNTVKVVTILAVEVAMVYCIVAFVLAIHFLPPATKLGQGYIFTCVCDSVHN